ncbi:Outer membrane protein OmpA [Sulfitobacter brevis]|uniref:Outer membrane protein OmpA n=1 Tax=Sulfitobacter brevis TaxID=74348 RepID=A0A1I1X4Q5_9RHOB|nr:OmpA family protein [Sulfitobacter brevis]SFE02347.1 Outer membrane protein OmpA [Sulfitobacter brevis]
MVNTISKAVRALASVALVAALAFQASAADAQTRSQQGRDKGQYIPTIWVDPDGCEHWVMDDGAEGYMTPHTTRQGIPVCRRGNVCGVMETDQFFATDSYRISSPGKARLANFFQTTGAVSYIITGHTDSRASDEYNMRLSYNRANSVAAVAAATGARIADVRGYGERMPAVANSSAANMAKNRRVEIICIR